MKNTVLLLILILMFTFISAAVAVIDTTGDEGDSLQHYIDAAAGFPLFNPDTIILMPGTYHLFINGDSGLVMRDSVILIGISALQCTLTAMDQGMTNSANHVVSFWNLGDCYSGLKYLTITGANTSEPGAGVFISNSNPFIDSCIIADNITSNYGGGIMIWNGAEPEITGNYISGNKAIIGAGICVDSLSNPVIRYNTVVFDSSSLAAGGMAISNSQASIINNNILNNNAPDVGGIAVLNSSNIIIDSCSINFNSASSGNGGGLHIENSQINVNFSDISQNFADSAGGGICIIHDNLSLFYGNTISNNIAEFGAGIGLADSSNTIIDSNTISNNSASAGGGIMAVNESSPIISKNSIIDNIASDAGGGIGLYINCSPSIEDNIIHSNSVNQFGGGIFMDDHCDPLIKGNSFMNNSTALYGGAIHAQFYSDPIIENNIIKGNSCLRYGGGLFIYDYSAPILNNNEIMNNTSRIGGGGIFVYSDASAALTANLIYGNSAANGGGALVGCDDVNISISQCIIANNSAGIGGAIYDTLNAQIIIDSSFITDNGSTGNTQSGFAHISANSGPGISVSIAASNIYYNTFQADTEIINLTNDTLNCENNYWFHTDSIDISGTVNGYIDFTPFSSDFISGAQREPVMVDSVRTYADTSYAFVIDTLYNPGTLYISLYGQNVFPDMREVAVSIISSSIYTQGIAVTLLETGHNSGIYRGSISVYETTGSDNIRNDDINNILRVNPVIDTIAITANIDSTSYWLVGYKTDLSSIIDMDTYYSGISCHVPAVMGNGGIFSYTVSDKKHVKIELLDITGRVIGIPVNGILEQGEYELNSKDIGIYHSGILFIRITAGNSIINKKTMIFN